MKSKNRLQSRATGGSWDHSNKTKTCRKSGLFRSWMFKLLKIDVNSDGLTKAYFFGRVCVLSDLFGLKVPPCARPPNRQKAYDASISSISHNK